MDDDIFPELSVLNAKKTYFKKAKKVIESEVPSDDVKKKDEEYIVEPLTTKVAVKFLLEGKLKYKVCRYCLNISPGLSDLDQIMKVAGAGTLYKVTIRDIVASFHPFKVHPDPNLPDKICPKCLDRALGAYLFAQQCERAERAILNCLDDMYEKLNKLDPIDKPKKRGRQKLNPNRNKIFAEHNKVMDYADPIINIVNVGAESVTQEPALNELECKKCWQVLPNMASLLNHENSHPKTMWYNCRLCGKSFAKLNTFRRHHHKVHILGNEVAHRVDNSFKCRECGHSTEDFIQHLQHIEKHRFRNILEHIIEKRMDKLCAVCFNKGDNMTELDKMVCIHGGHPELMGDKTLYSLLASTLPNMNNLNNYIGTKICNRCLNHAITSYIFIQQFIFTRERLDTCVGVTLDNISKMQPEGNIFVQISQQTIMPAIEIADESLICDENDIIDESKLKVHVLEDEFRVKSDDSESDDTETKDDKSTISVNKLDVMLDNPARNATKTYTKNKLVNGIQNKYSMDICSEFLTFKKRVVKKHLVKFTCPLCSKHFISDYFLKRHILKHINKKVNCNVCNIEFKSKFHLYEHTKMVHLLKEENYTCCNICSRAFLNEDKLKIHEKHHKCKECELCDKVFVSQRKYNNHIQRHASKLKLIQQKRLQTCSFCEKECPNDNELSLHVNKVHLQIKPYSCDMCERQFYTENNLKYHKKVHSMYSKETCEFCNKTLRCRKQLVIHVRKHIGVKPFSCQICGQAFYSTFKAREHMKVYHGGRFCCRICKTTFVTKYGLKDHVNNEHGFV
ncbi:uncharacterized protein LOC142984203 [Anticarsia gemmatalis]|uniref:uncharacterized protein LOC142984203 n=1 Tax=Anticarsia gemmatalis TaxID=129554 RepID=UPI003F76A8A8